MQPRPVPVPVSPMPHPVQPQMAPQPLPQGMQPQMVPQQMVPMAPAPQMPQGGMPTGAMPQGQMPAPGNVSAAPQMAAAQAYAPLQDDNRDSGEKPLASMSVHAFCDRQETAHWINEKTRDWRMKRNKVKN